MIDPLLSAMSPDYILPTSQSIGNAAIIAVFAYLVPLLTMEINFFRLAVYKSWRRMNSNNIDMQKHENASNDIDEHDKNNTRIAAVKEDDNVSDTSSAVGHLMAGVTSAIHETTSNVRHSFSPSNAAQTTTIQDHSITIPHDTSTLQLQEAYTAIRKSSMEAIISSLLLYTVTAIGISLGTRGLDPKVIAVIIGASQFMTALMVFIVSAKVPQWIGVYHEGKIRLVKCSSPYSQQFEHINLSSFQEEDDTKANYTRKLKWNVRLGVWFHFSKFYIILMPFYCGVQKITIPLSMICGSLFGFILMWAVFVVHEKYIHHRNIVSFTTILLLSIISALCFTRGMAWMQMVWKLDILKDPDVLMTISFFTWLAILAIVHALFIWHTLKTEETQSGSRRSGPEETEEESLFLNEDGGNPSTHEDPSNHSKKKAIRRSSSYSSFVFDPRTHFKDTEHPDLDLSDRLTPSPVVDETPVDNKEDNVDEPRVGEGQQDQDDTEPEMHTDCLKDENDIDSDQYLEGYCIETPMPAATDNNIANSIGLLLEDDEDFDNDESAVLEIDIEEDEDNPPPKKRRPLCCRPAYCEVFVCFSPEYQQSSCLWKAIVWFKFIIIIITYLLCLYFVTVSIGATAQIKSTRENLPAVQEALYNHINEGEVCAFDNQGPASNITTFPSKEAAHEAGFLVLHCGACGACSTWENLIIEYTTRDTMAANANQCAKEALFGGGDDALTECLMEPNIGFGYECATCWMEDILCTKEHCSFIFLQSQMINEVTNFAVGPDDITSATCEEAHCEKGPDQFVPCSGATRRRMNITSSISRPGDQQCAIVDVESWEDLFFGSGVA